MEEEQKELRVLILEDSPTDAELMEHELRKAGMVFTAKRVDTREAFTRALEKFTPDVILSDYKLPDFDGLSALKIVRHEHPEVPVIMVTGALVDIEAMELIHAGARDYLLKDRLARLVSAVQRALSAEQGIRARKAAEKKLAVRLDELERFHKVSINREFKMSELFEENKKLKQRIEELGEKNAGGTKQTLLGKLFGG